jgi:succinoglycan biosynthesis protein ExoA
VSGLVTVAIPTLDEEGAIGECLQRVLGQTHRDLQVLVADGGSRDRTREIVAKALARDRRIALVENPGRLQSAGLDAALRAAEGAIVVRIDARSFVEPDYVERCATLLSETGAAVVGGRMVARPEASLVARGIAVANAAWWGAGPARFHAGGEPGPADTVYLGAFDTGWLRLVGGWDPDLPVNEDWELNHRIRRAGGVVWLDPSIEVGYRPRRTFGALARQYFRYGRGKATVVRMHPEGLLPRQALPAMLAPAAVLAVAPGAPPPVRTAARLAVAGHATAVALAAARADGPATERATAAVAAVVMHWSWATGAWFGALRPYAPSRLT